MDQFIEQQDDEKPIYRSKLRASKEELQFRFLAKYGDVTLLDWEGHPKSRRHVTLADLKELIEAEAVIEKATGLRIHILQVVE